MKCFRKNELSIKGENICSITNKHCNIKRLCKYCDIAKKWLKDNLKKD